eukprot:TRINITY_DN976_c0_g1_i1.p1 TRINITY_DN976_c0_g1~~TRINITY_DN976_c0_g1_i1.p1  ORF type:complete len:310 (-),score=100.07 TRINITY_DN976_c0_g1_i1:192-1082(-)
MATVADVMQLLGEKEGVLIVLSPNQTIESAMEVLNENQILSAPLVNGSGRFQGIVDVHDMLELVVQSYEQGEGPEQWAALLSNTVDKCVGKNKHRDISFLAKGPGTSRPIREVVASKFLPANVHRLCVSDCDGHPLAIFSQSDVLRYLKLVPEQIGSKGSHTLQDLGFAERPVISLPSTALAIDGLALMRHKHIHVLPVLDADGKLLAQLSTSSLRGLCIKHLQSLRRPVLEFLNNHLPARHAESPTPLRVTATDTLRHCIAELCAASAHECFVVDPEGHVKAVMTLTDVLRLIWG